MRTSKDIYKIINGKKILWKGYDYKNQYWVFEGKKDTRTLEELRKATKKNMKYICPNCQKERINDFPISDETGDTYCPDCNWTIDKEE